MTRTYILVALVALAAAARAYHIPLDADWEARWLHSEDAKYAGNRLVVEELDVSGVPALKIPHKARHYGISSLLPTPIDPSEGLVLQYEVKLPAGGLTCGGAYLKFLSADDSFSPATLTDSTPYSIMFGPDKCGSNSKTHLIVRHTSPKTGETEEKHLVAPPAFTNDNLTHVFTAIFRKDNTYSVLIDGAELRDGSVFDDFSPAINPPETIPDPEDVKPEDWVDEAQIPDPEASKPEDWDEDAPAEVEDEEAEMPEGWLVDEPAEIDDPEAEAPEDWDEEEDGEWEAPTVPNPACVAAPGCGPWTRPKVANPAYRGRWSAPLVPNPAYKGPWAPRDIPNPDYHKDETPLAHIGKIGAVAIEVWTMDEDYYFGDVVIGTSEEEAAEVRETSWKPIHDAELAAKEAQEEAEKVAAAERAARKGEDDEDDEDDDASPLASAKEFYAALPALVFDQPFLRPYASQLAPVRAFFEANTIAVVVVTLLAIFLVAYFILAFLSAVVPKKPRRAAAPAKVSKAAVAAAKKADVTSADDPAEGQVEEDEEDESKQADAIKAATATVGAHRRPAKRA